MSTQTSSISLDADYLRSRQGVLRIFEAIIGICGIICVNNGAYCGYWDMYRFYNFVVWTTLILAIFFIVLFVFRLDKLITFINWYMCVLINDAVFSILYLVATILIIITIGSCRAGQVARIFAALFGICGTIDVGLLALFAHRFGRSGTAPKSEGV